MRDMHASIAAAFVRRTWFAEAGTTFGTLLYDHLCVFLWLVASVAWWGLELWVISILQGRYVSGLTASFLRCTTSLPFGVILFALLLSRVRVHCQWFHTVTSRRLSLPYDHRNPGGPLLPKVKMGIGRSHRLFRRFYPEHCKEDEWDMVIRFESLMCRLIGVFLLMTLSLLGGLFLQMGSGLERYGQQCQYRREVRQRDKKQRELQRAQMKAARRAARWVSSVVSPPRKSFEEIKKSHQDIE
jgi:hypothetical protein